MWLRPGSPGLSKRGVKPLQFDPSIGGCELSVGFGAYSGPMGLPVAISVEKTYIEVNDR
jgi:hypothetical protein